MSKELQFLIYNTPQEDVRVDVVIRDETLWLTQKALASLFGVQVPAISKHLKNIFEEGELEEKVVVSKLETTTPHGAILEDLIESENAFTMEDFAGSVNEFLAFRKFQILEGKGKMSKRQADQKAELEYDFFNKTQRIVSDFDKSVKKLGQCTIYRARCTIEDSETEN